MVNEAEYGEFKIPHGQRRRNMANLKVEDIMSRNLVTVEPSEDLATANELMIEKNIRHLPVVDPSGNLKGIVSDRDLIRYANFLKDHKISEVMSTKIETVTAEDSLGDVATILLEGTLSSLPVVEGTQLIGIVTPTDFVRTFTELS